MRRKFGACSWKLPSDSPDNQPELHRSGLRDTRRRPRIAAHADRNRPRRLSTPGRTQHPPVSPRTLANHISRLGRIFRSISQKLHQPIAGRLSCTLLKKFGSSFHPDSLNEVCDVIRDGVEPNFTSGDLPSVVLGMRSGMQRTKFPAPKGRHMTAQGGIARENRADASPGYGTTHEIAPMGRNSHK